MSGAGETVTTGTAPGSDGNALAWRVEGREGAPWLILSNSLATDMSMWQPQIAALAASRRVLRYDTRGHGASAAVAPPYTPSLLAGDVVALMDHLGIERADFMGLSLGGMTGLALAMRHPARIGRLVCADARADAPPAYRAIWDANIARLREAGIEALVEPTLERWFTAEFRADPANAALLDEVRAMIRRTSPEGYEGVGRFLQSLDLLPGLAGIASPVLYVAGENDMAAPVAVMEAMAQATPGARLQVIAGAAHLSNMEKPQAFLAAVSDFLGID